MRTPSLLGQVFLAFDAAEVRWALLRGQAGLGVAGHDVDLLVAGDDIGPVEDIIFAMGGMALPRSTHPWHRFYFLEDRESGTRLVLDIVTEVIYNRRLQIRSGLETSCLARCRRDGVLSVLDPTDMFWTVLLHGLLDKDRLTERRRAELDRTVDDVTRPSPAEAFFETLCPPGWSADRALEVARARDWAALSRLGLQISSARQLGAQPTAATDPRGTAAVVTAARRTLRSAARTVYPVVWRRAGLGVTAGVLDVMEAADTDAILVEVRRKPWLCEVELLVADEHLHRLVGVAREHDYRRTIGGWIRLTDVGLEHVRLVTQSQLGLSGPAWAHLWSTSSPVPGHPHCRRASAGARVLVAAAQVDGGRVGRQRSRQLRAASSRAWAEARKVATDHGLFHQLEFLTHGREQLMATGARAGQNIASTHPRNGRGRAVRVSFSGLDGSGKSSQIGALATAAAHEHSVEVLWLPTRVWPETLLNRLPAGFRSRLGPKRSTTLRVHDSAQTSPQRKTGTSAVQSAAWLGVATFAAISVGLSLRRRASSSSADLVVLDRYRLDSLVKLQCWYPEVSDAWLTRIVMTLAPAPDVEFLLRVEPEVAYARKAEQWSVKQLSRQARLYDRLAADARPVVTLDAEREADDLALEVRTQVGAAFDVG